MHTFRRKMLLVAVVAMVSGLAHAATEDDEPVRSVDVRYGDLDLSSPEGVHVLKRRISSAALKVCGVDPASVVASARGSRNCVQLASERALAQVRWSSIRWSSK